MFVTVNNKLTPVFMRLLLAINFVITLSNNGVVKFIIKNKTNARQTDIKFVKRDPVFLANVKICASARFVLEKYWSSYFSYFLHVYAYGPSHKRGQKTFKEKTRSMFSYTDRTVN